MAVTANINTSAWDRLIRRFAGIGTRRVGVGIFGDEELAVIAASHEYGARVMRDGQQVGSIPERSYIRSTLREREGDLARVMRRIGAGWMAGTMTVEQGLGLLGLYTANAVKAKIRSNIPPPLAARTIARKGSSKALVDTGRLINSITWKIIP